MEEKDRLNVSEVARMLTLSEQQVYRRIERGDLKAHVVYSDNNQPRYVVDEADAVRYRDEGCPLTAPRADPVWISPSEVARLTGLSVQKVRRLCNDGTFSHRRSKEKASHIRVYRPSIEEYVRENEPAASA